MTPADALPARGSSGHPALRGSRSTRPYATVFFMRILALLAGGALGTLARYALSGYAYSRLGTAFPWGTLAVNVAGCFAVGLLWAWAERVPFPPVLATFAFLGFLGAFTTFSTYGLETLNLLRQGEGLRALVNVAASNGLGLLAVLGGHLTFRLLLSLLRPGTP